MSRVVWMLTIILSLTGCANMVELVPSPVVDDEVIETEPPVLVDEWILADIESNRVLAKMTLSRMSYTQALLSIELLEDLDHGSFTIYMPDCLRFLPKQAPLGFSPEFQFEQKLKGNVIEFWISNWQEVDDLCSPEGKLVYDVRSEQYWANKTLTFNWLKHHIIEPERQQLFEVPLIAGVSKFHFATISLFREGATQASVLVEAVEWLQYAEVSMELPTCFDPVPLSFTPVRTIVSLDPGLYYIQFEWDKFDETCDGSGTLLFNIATFKHGDRGSVPFDWGRNS